MPWMLAFHLWMILVVARLAWAARAGTIGGPIVWTATGAAGTFAAAVLGLAMGSPFAALAMLAWTLFIWSPAVGFAVAAWCRDRVAFGIGLTSVLLAATGLYAMVIEPQRLQVRHETLVVPDLEVPVTVAVVADFQADRIGAYERRALRTVAELEPDLIVWPGDVLHLWPHATWSASVPDVQRALATLPTPPLGMVAVQGNNEAHFADWPRLFEGTGAWTPTRRESRRFGPLTVTALPLRDGYDRDLVVPAVAGPHLVVGHVPDFALSDDVEADVLIAGHTHGGQVQLPFVGPLVTFSAIPRAWAAGGVTDLSGGRRLVVSRGVGMERLDAPRLRFLCAPEIVMLHLVPGASR